MKYSTCCFTGHRELAERKKKEIEDALEDTIYVLIESGIHTFLTGGARGFDEIAAHAVLKQKEKNPSIRLFLYLPCKDQTIYWKMEDIIAYEQIKKRADEVVYFSEEYHPGCMQERNRALVNNSDVCVCYMTKLSGGTGYTVNYCKEKGIPIINLARKD